MRHPVRLVCAVLFVLAALVGVPGAALAHPTVGGAAGPAAAADPDPLATVGVKHWGSEFDGIGVLADAPSGRIMVFAYADDVGRFVHFGFGRATASGGCKVVRWVVLDQQDNAHAWLYDAQWQPVDFTPIHRWGQYYETDDWMHYLRLETAPGSFPTDCAKVSGHAHRDPASRQVGPTFTGDLGPMTSLGYHSTNLLQVPSKFPYGTDSQLTFSLEPRPNGADWEELLTPPVPVEVEVELPPGSGLEVTGPVPPQTLDLWTYDAPVTGTLGVRPATPYAVHPRIRITAAGLTLGEDGTADYDEITRSVSVPPPTGWSGTLAGQTLWGRAPDKWHEPYHSVLTFLDDEWVFLSDQAADPVPATCDTVAPKIRAGCHRYYYDAASGQLQVDDIRLRPVTDPAGWELPWQSEPVRSGTSIGPVAAGTRVSYGGRGSTFNCSPLPGRSRGCAVSDIELVLHRDGTYRFTKVSSIDGVQKTHHGRYRFTGTSLVLDPAKHPPVTLDGVVGYYQDGVLEDLDWSVAGVYGAEG
ncbi:hypothetical protein [Nocardioides panacisoli]|uniref:Uncharacterized protein n=1 Tax=Nocardioides panacisoli TaxID=627624 RepID=A0ABP7J056_9ACTN